MSELEAMNTADLIVLSIQVFRDGTLNRVQLSGGVAMSAGGINFPGHAVNGCGMRCTIIGIGIAFQSNGNSGSDLFEGFGDVNALFYRACISGWIQFWNCQILTEVTKVLYANFNLPPFFQKSLG